MSPDLPKKEVTTDFGKVASRKPLFLTPEQLEVIAEKKQREEERMQKAQRYTEAL